MAATGFAVAKATIEAATWYQNIFSEPDAAAIKTAYRRLMRDVHPDRVAPVHAPVATDLVHKLTGLYDEALGALGNGTFGIRQPIGVLTSPRSTHQLIEVNDIYSDIANGYRGLSNVSGRDRDSFVKVAALGRDNDLFAAEAASLTRLRDTAGDEFTAFYPELIDSFVIMDGRIRRRVTVLGWMEGFYNLIELRHYRPDGLSPLDAAWVWRRLLWALGGAHDAGVVHTAVLPQHVMVHPKLHGVVLVDWCYSRRSLDGTYPAISALVGARRSWYPAEVLAKQPLTPTADLRMAARTLCYLLGGDGASMTMPSAVPLRMQQYFVRTARGDTDASNAFELLAQFDRVLQRLGSPYHPRVYRELVL